MNDVLIRKVEALTTDELHQLSDVLIDCVEGGASVSFMYPMTRSKANAYWNDVAMGVTRGDRLLIVAQDTQGIMGTVQVVWETPENQPHRGDLSKMLVHRRARGRGVGEAVLAAAERAAIDAGKTLLVLDTASDVAERLYERRGWQRVGVIPDFALWPGGGTCPTTVYYKQLVAD